MSLKLLNPGLRPLGQFDLADSAAGALEGGEYVELAADPGLSEGYAADVDMGAVPSDGGVSLRFAPDDRTAGNLGGLADEGTDQYGTLFGSLIGSTVGQATSVPGGGAVVIGPSTDRGSGKVTVWAQAGLYGANGAATDDATTPASAASVNDPLHADSDGLLTTDTDSEDQVGIYVGQVSDSSLVSTTNTAVGLAAATEYHALFYTGNAQA